ncbi:MAG: GAF domain-containing protein [Pseudomonadota bacterium]
MPKPSDDYDLLYRQLDALVTGEASRTAALANSSALLFNTLADVNWVGFYLTAGKELVLGPFQGQVACTRIPWGSGVCGTAAATQTTQRVADVHVFEGHIACDSASASELVVPLIRGGHVVAVLDIDSPTEDRFSADDQRGLERIGRRLEAVF